MGAQISVDGCSTIFGGINVSVGRFTPKNSELGHVDAFSVFGLFSGPGDFRENRGDRDDQGNRGDRGLGDYIWVIG